MKPLNLPSDFIFQGKIIPKGTYLPESEEEFAFLSQALNRLSERNREALISEENIDENAHGKYTQEEVDTLVNEAINRVAFEYKEKLADKQAEIDKIQAEIAEIQAKQATSASKPHSAAKVD